VYSYEYVQAPQQYKQSPGSQRPTIAAWEDELIGHEYELIGAILLLQGEYFHGLSRLDLPPERTKQGRKHCVPLSKECMPPGGLVNPGDP